MAEHKKPAAGMGAARRMEEAQRIIDAKALAKLERDLNATPAPRRGCDNRARSGK